MNQIRQVRPYSDKLYEIANARNLMTSVDDLYTEDGKPGVDGAYAVESGQYTALLFGTHRWSTPTGRKRSMKVAVILTGSTARRLAAELRDMGFRPPRGLGRLCESAPRSTPR